MCRSILMRVASLLTVTILLGLGALFFPLLTGQDTPKPKLDRKLLAEAEKLDEEAQELYLAGKYAQSAEKLEAASRLAEKAYFGGPGASAGYFLGRAANMHMLLGNMELAERCMRDARDKHWAPLRKLVAKERDKELEAGAVEMMVDCELYLATILLERGKFAEAGRGLAKTLAIRGEFPPDKKDLEGQRQVALAHIYLGVVKHRTGDVVNARQEMEVAIQNLYATSGGKDTHETLAARLQYAHLLHELLEYKTAKDILLDCREKCSKVFPKSRYNNGHPYTVQCLSLLGLTCSVLGEFADAESYLLEARQLQLKLSATQWDNTVADISNKLGLLAEIQGKSEEAEKHYAASLEVRGKLHGNKAHPDLADAKHNMGGILVFRRRFKEATSELKEAIVLWEELYSPKDYPDGHPKLARALLLRSLAATGTDDRKSAKSFAASALTMYQRQAELFAAQSSEAEALNFVMELSVFRSGYLSACSGLDESPDYDLLWSGKSLVFRVLTDRQRSLSDEALKDAKVRKLVAEWRDARGRLAGLVLSQASLLDRERATQVAELSNEKESLERLLKATAARNILPQSSPTLKDLVATIPEQAAFVDIFRYNRLSPAAFMDSIVPSYIAFIVRRDRRTVAVDLGSAKPIDEALAAWTRQVLAEHREDSAEVVRRLVWKHLAAHLPTQNGATIYISPDGELARLPWAAMPGNKLGRFLLQDYRLALVPNGSFLAERLVTTARRFGTKPASGTFLLVADVAYSKKPPLVLGSGPFALASVRDISADEFPELRGTALEADWIRPLVTKLPGDPRLVEWRKEKANVCQVLADLPGATIAHIATHGFFAEASSSTQSRFFRSADFAVTPNGIRLGAGVRNPLSQVALVLAGANLKPDPAVGTCYLSGEMVAGLDLRRGRLYVLPDCHTARGEVVAGAGVYGLQRALHQAGVDDVLAGLWGVSDKTTPAVMLLFYHHLAAGKSPLDALRESQLFLLRNPDAVELLWKKNAPSDIAKLVSDRPRGFDPDFVPRLLPSAPRISPKGENGNLISTKDWAVFVLSGIGE